MECRTVKLGKLFCLILSICLLASVFGCGKGDESAGAKVRVKVLLTNTPQSDSWSGKFDTLLVRGKLEGAAKGSGGELDIKFRVKKEIILEDSRGKGVIVNMGELKPGKWNISIKYTRDGSILAMNKGVGKATVNLLDGKLGKLFFSYSPAKGFVTVTEKVSKDEEKEFFISKQNKFKKRPPPPEAEPDYEAEGY